ncbi:hypothetical protein HDU97_004238 [Phlyctochytrium planicorne]|nr:hypothetical protein HDU97_004238 [Phlyctochytrium planicorne]
MHFNMAVTHLNMKQGQEAISCFTKALNCDKFMAVSYYLRGVCFYAQGSYSEALADFNDALTYLRGNLMIDYNQLGLPFKLFAYKASYNRGLCFASLKQIEAALSDFDYAMRTRPPESPKEEYERVQEALVHGQKCTQYCRPFSMPLNLIYKPSAEMTKNLEKIEYLGKALVVATIDADDKVMGFKDSKLRVDTLSRKHSRPDLTEEPEEMTSSSRSSSLGRNFDSRKPPLLSTIFPFATLSRRRPSEFESPTSSPVTPVSAKSMGFLESRQRQMESAKPPLTPTVTAATPGNGKKERTIRRLPSAPLLKTSSKTTEDRNQSPLRTQTLGRWKATESKDLASPATPVTTSLPRGATLNRKGSKYLSNQSYGETAAAAVEDGYSLDTLARKPKSNDDDKVTVKVRFHYTETKIFLVPLTISLESLLLKLQKKFSSPRPLKLRYRRDAPFDPNTLPRSAKRSGSGRSDDSTFPPFDKENLGEAETDTLGRRKGDFVSITNQKQLEEALWIALTDEASDVCSPGGEVGGKKAKRMFEIWCFM